ncbi:hypothetical protein B0H19DRAFT_1233259 [Mycena capillaripes]|nr:hypothetical protein B0H19DRAFT_1233259 [Mycena capillaripes]
MSKPSAYLPLFNASAGTSPPQYQQGHPAKHQTTCENTRLRDRLPTRLMPYANNGPTDSIVDSIHVQPQKTLKNSDHIPARFDTALVNTGKQAFQDIESQK